MDELAALRNFKDFLLIYNRMTEHCFSRCIDSLNQRSLTVNEEQCVDKCANKHVNINHKLMSIYMEVQPIIANKRNEELEKEMQANSISPDTMNANSTVAENPSLETTQSGSVLSNNESITE